MYMLDTRKIEKHYNMIFNESIGHSGQAILNNIRESETENERKKEETYFITLPFDMHSSDNNNKKSEIQIQI